MNDAELKEIKKLFEEEYLLVKRIHLKAIGWSAGTVATAIVLILGFSVFSVIRDQIQSAIGKETIQQIAEHETDAAESVARLELLEARWSDQRLVAYQEQIAGQMEQHQSNYEQQFTQNQSQINDRFNDTRDEMYALINRYGVKNLDGIDLDLGARAILRSVHLEESEYIQNNFVRDDHRRIWFDWHQRDQRPANNNWSHEGLNRPRVFPDGLEYHANLLDQFLISSEDIEILINEIDQYDDFKEGWSPEVSSTLILELRELKNLSLLRELRELRDRQGDVGID